MPRHAHRIPIPRPPRLSSSPPNACRLQCRQTRSVDRQRASALRLRTASSRPGGETRMLLVCSPRACVQALSAASLASKSRAKDGFPFRYRLRHACPAVSLATVRQRVGSLAVGGRYIGGRAGWAPCWRAGVLLVGLHCTYTHISIVCFHTRKSPRATNHLLLIPTLRVQNPPLDPVLPTASRPPNEAKAKPNKHRHSSTATQPHLTSHIPPQPQSCPAPT